MRNMNDIGIDHMAAYFPSQFLPLESLAIARNVDVKKYHAGIGVVEMSIPAYGDDVVSMGANAGLRLLQESGVDPKEIGLLIVGTESSEDRAKPDASLIHSLLGIGESCRVFNITHACAGANYGLVSAIDWLKADSSRNYAMVIASDIAMYGVGSAGEPTQGAGAVALMVSRSPRLLRIKELATFSNNVYDFWRPIREPFPIVKGVFSVQCYLKAAIACFKKVAIDQNYDFVYHTPYPKLVEKIHHEICSLMGISLDKRSVHYQEKVAPSNEFSAKIGNTYTASLWFALIGCIEFKLKNLTRDLDSKDKNKGMYLFSYGSGSGAILMEATLSNYWVKMAKLFNCADDLINRATLTIEEYEKILSGEKLQNINEPGAVRFIFSGCENHQRKYELINRQ
jgi:hydroxymethylglutaryl-CoA synthase